MVSPRVVGITEKKGKSRDETRNKSCIGIKIKPKTTENRGIHRVVAVVAVERTAKRRECDWHLSQRMWHTHGVILGGKAHPLLSLLSPAWHDNMDDNHSSLRPRPSVLVVFFLLLTLARHAPPALRLPSGVESMAGFWW